MKTFLVRSGLRALVSMTVFVMMIGLSCWIGKASYLDDRAICVLIIPVVWGGFWLYERAAGLVDKWADKIKEKEVEEQIELIQRVVKQMIG